MDAIGHNPSRRNHPMTIAEKTARRTARIKELRNRIKGVLTGQPDGLDLTSIEFYLKAQQIQNQDNADELDTFQVRDAVSSMERSGEITRSSGGRYKLSLSKISANQ